MLHLIEKLIGDKKEWRAMEARAKDLPDDYTFVYHKIQHYMWNHAAGSGMDMIAIFKDLLDLFEEGHANKKHVLEITGKDVASFSDELLKNARTYTEDWHVKLNADIAKRFKK